MRTVRATGKKWCVGAPQEAKKLFIALFHSLYIRSFPALRLQQPRRLPALKHGCISRLDLTFWNQIRRGCFLTPFLCCVSLVLLPACMAQQPALTSPAPGSVLPGSSVTFIWSGAGRGNSQYQLWLGTTGPGSENVGAYA